MVRLTLLLLLISAFAACDPGKTYVSPLGNFEVVMPREPALETVSLNSPVGQVNMIWAKANVDEVVFKAGFTDFSPDLVKRAGVKNIMQGMQQQVASNTKGKIIEVRWDEDLLGMRFVIFQEQGASSGHYYVMRKNRFYQLMIEGPIAEVRGDRADQFLSSLKIH